jgi:predicted Rdx family selenoprotein
VSNANWPLNGIAGAIVEGLSRWERKPHDLYPTPEDATQAIIDALRLPKDALIYDPGCGDGKLLRVFTANGYMNTVGSDLRHTGYGRGGWDYLSPDQTILWERKPDAIIMNPPFSRALEFIEKALTQAPVVATLLKADFFNAQDRTTLGRAQPPTHHYPLTWRPIFLAKERGKNPLMNCTWFVWRRDMSGKIFWRQLDKPTEYPVLEYRGISVVSAELGDAFDMLSEAMCAAV